MATSIAVRSSTKRWICATGWDRPAHSADFGQTLGVWGVPPGPAVQLPLFGPSNVRDSFGKVAGIVLSPTSYVTAGAVTVVTTAGSGIRLVDGRATLLPTTDALQKTSLDYYATLRSTSEQHRIFMVEQGKAGLVAGPEENTNPAKPHQVSLSATPQ
jgi:phospholipid-binding lipoprotein MlaA